MRKNILFAITILLGACAGPVKKTSLEQENIKGSVKGVRDYTYKAINGEEQTDSVALSHVSQYDEKGNITSWKSLSIDGEEISRSDYEYDEVGVWLRQVSTDSSGSTKQIVPEYDQMHNLTGSRQYSEDGTLEHINQFVFDKEGRYTDVLTFLPSNTLLAKHEYLHEGDQCIKETYNYQNRGNLTYFYSYEDLDEQGNWRRKLAHTEDDRFVFLVTRELSYY